MSRSGFSVTTGTLENVLPKCPVCKRVKTAHNPDNGRMIENTRDVLPGEEKAGQVTKAVFQHMESYQSELGCVLLLRLYREKLDTGFFSI